VKLGAPPVPKKPGPLEAGRHARSEAAPNVDGPSGDQSAPGSSGGAREARAALDALTDAPPLAKVTPGALTRNEGGAPRPAAIVAAQVGRPRAAWSERSDALAAQALAAAAGRSGAEAVQAIVDAILESPELRGARLACAVSLAGTDVVARGVEAPVNPCSNAKLVTAGYALSVLGPLHRFTTDVLRAPGAALVWRGCFDPTLTPDDLLQMARELAARGVVRVPGVVVDNTALAGGNVPRGFAKYGDEDWEYLARPEALSVNKNALRISVKPGAAPGLPAQVELDTTAFVVHSSATTAPAGTKFRLGCDELDTAGVLQRDESGRAIIRVWGEVAADYAKGKQLVMKSPSPTEGFIDRLLWALGEVGIAVEGPVTEGPTPAGATPVLQHKSEPLGEILTTSLASSNAFDHEMFALAASCKERAGPSSLADATAALERFLQAATGEAGAMVNASGIGNECKLTATAVVRLIEKAAREPRLTPLLSALAAPGERGTLKSRMVDTAAEGAFRGKTGTGEGAVALSGIIQGAERAVVMSLLVEEVAGTRDGARAALDGLAIALSAFASR
jgi:serine-type D-Ala-D-Ala carboxypeptidase/endopeptidase (penicillin-binding protein 4)